MKCNNLIGCAIINLSDNIIIELKACVRRLIASTSLSAVNINLKLVIEKIKFKKCVSYVCKVMTSKQLLSSETELKLCCVEPNKL